MRSVISAAIIAISLLCKPLSAGEFTEVVLEPIDHADAQLIVVSLDGTEISYTPAQLEEFATYRLVTTTPWRDEPAEFEGVILSDILAANGLLSADSIVVTAENDYSTSLPRSLLENVVILVATRVNGKPHSRRERGPIQFIIDAETYASSSHTSEANLVWMAARIEAGD